jgi:hypothetical protein
MHLLFCIWDFSRSKCLMNSKSLCLIEEKNGVHHCTKDYGVTVMDDGIQ